MRSILRWLYDVFGEDVLVERVAGRAVDVEDAVLAEAAGPLGEELPSLLAGLLALGGRLELAARPEDGLLGGAVEALRVEHGPLVVVPEDDHLALHHPVDALAGVRPVADHIAEAVDFGDVLLVDIPEDRLQRFEITVDVADDRLHA